MPLRGFNTWINGWTVVEEGYHMSRIITEAYTAIEQEDKFAIIISLALLHEKFQKAVIENQHLRKNERQLESKLYNEVDKDFVMGTLNTKSSIPITAAQKKHALNYLSFFKHYPSIEQQNSSTPILDAMW